MSEQIELHVEGISCEGCERRAETVLRRLPGVAEATANHHTGRVTVTFPDGGLVDRDQIVARLSTAGFEPVAEETP